MKHRYEVPEGLFVQLMATPNDIVSPAGHGDEGVGGRGSNVQVGCGSRGCVITPTSTSHMRIVSRIVI